MSKRHFLYGFNVRNYKKKTLNPVSDEMMIARSGFNAMGAPHYGQSKRIIPPTTQLTQLGVVFNRDDYCFHHCRITISLPDSSNGHQISNMSSTSPRICPKRLRR